MFGFNIDKFIYKINKKLLKSKRFANLKSVRYFKNYWLHIVQKEIYELDTRYYGGTLSEKEVFLKIKKEFGNKIVVPFIDLCVGTTCTLKCKDCTEWIPYLQNKKNFTAEEVIGNLEQLFKYVDYVHFVSPLGGEAFLNPDLHKILLYLKQKCEENKIGYVRLVTNGTIFPSTDLLDIFAYPKFSIAISNYSNVLTDNQKNNVEKFKAYFNEKNYKLYFPEDFDWIYLGCPDKKFNRETSVLKDTFEKCFVHNCAGLFENCIYHCGRAYILHKDKKQYPNNSEYIDISNIKSRREMKKALYNFYTCEYSNTCDWCCLPTEYKRIEPAIQL